MPAYFSAMALRTKVVLILIIASVLGDVLFITLWQPWYLTQSMKRERQTLQGHLITLGDAVSPFLLQNQIGAVYEVFDATLERQPEWRSLVLNDADGVLVYPLDPVSPVATEHSERMSHTIVLRNGTLGRIDLVADLSGRIQLMRRETILILGFITLGFVLAGVLIAVTLEVVIGRRSRELVAAAKQIGLGNFSARVPEDIPDEIGRVAQALNAMRESIAEKEHLLVKAKDAAENSDRAKSAFLATMSHEIRTPMNGILGMAQLLLESELSSRDRRDYARTIINSGQTLLTLLNDILDLSKVEAGKFVIESSSLDPAQILQETKLLFAEPASRKGLGIEVVWSGPRLLYRSDPHRLRQILANLVGNAIKFTTQGHVRVEASEVARDAQTATLEFAVIDTGLGIPEDKQSLLFQPFTQVDSSTTRQFGGTGLGLSIVRSLAELMGGEVGVDSRVNQGSRFWFRIRAELVAEEAESPRVAPVVPVPLPQSPAPVSMPEQLSGRVLLVEDNLTNRKVAEVMLKKLGLTVAIAEHGQQGLDAITGGETPDIILMDVQMPVMDGYTATERIRSWEAEQGRPRLPIIALTADAFEEDRRRSQEAGMDDFLTKPIVRDTLRLVLARWLPAAAAPTATRSAGAAFDPAKVRVLVSEIIPLLQQHRFDAVVKFKELQDVLARTEFEAEIANMKTSLDLLNFELAHGQLVRLAKAQHWSAADS